MVAGGRTEYVQCCQCWEKFSDLGEKMLAKVYNAMCVKMLVAPVSTQGKQARIF